MDTRSTTRRSRSNTTTIPPPPLYAQELSLETPESGDAKIHAEIEHLNRLQNVLMGVCVVLIWLAWYFFASPVR